MKKANFLVMLTLLNASAFNAAPTAKGQPPPRLTQEKPKFLSGLSEAEYPLDIFPAGKIKLINGLAEEPNAPGSATKIRVQLGKERAFGDINHDGALDAVVSLYVDTGGSGSFIYLSAVINRQNEPDSATTIFLGDRISIQSLAIESEIISLTTLERKPDEPMSAIPSVEKARKFIFQDNQLLEQ
jgi:hypothetical protein